MIGRSDYPGDPDELAHWNAEMAEQKRISSYDDISGISASVEQISEQLQRLAAEQERSNIEVLQQLKRLEGQRTASTLLLALILAVLLYIAS